MSQTDPREAMLTAGSDLASLLERTVMETEGERNDGVVELECLHDDDGLRFTGLLWRLGPVRVDLLRVDIPSSPGADGQVTWGGDFADRQDAERAWRRGAQPSWKHALRIESPWSRAYEAFLSSPRVWARHTPWARANRVLPISTRWDYVFGVDQQGTVWANLDEDLGGHLGRFYPAPPSRVWVTRHRQGALLEGAKTRPWLRRWAGRRPSDAVDCEQCRGHSLPHPLVCACGGAGWLTPEEAVALGQRTPLPSHVTDYIVDHATATFTDAERGALWLDLWTVKGVVTHMKKRVLLADGSEEALADGAEVFIERLCTRVLREHEPEVIFNRCPRCNGLCRTLRAQQCRWCGHDWHPSSLDGPRRRVAVGNEAEEG